MGYTSHPSVKQWSGLKGLFNSVTVWHGGCWQPGSVACLGSLTQLALIHITAPIISPVCCDVSTSSARHLGKCISKTLHAHNATPSCRLRESFSSEVNKRLDGPSARATASPGMKSKMCNYRPHQSVYHFVSLINLAVLMPLLENLVSALATQ